MMMMMMDRGPAQKPVKAVVASSQKIVKFSYKVNKYDRSLQSSARGLFPTADGS